MNNYRLRFLKSDGTISDSDLVRAVVARFDTAKQHSMSFHRDCVLLSDLVRGVYQGKVNLKRNNIRLPFVLATTLADVAVKYRAMFAGYPYVEFEGAPGYERRARVQTGVVNTQLHRQRLASRGIDLLESTTIYGSQIIQYGYDYRTRTFPVPGENPGEVNFQEIILSDQPGFGLPDPLDCFPEPGRHDFHDMKYFIVRESNVDFDDIRDDMEQGVYEKSALKKLEESGHPGTEMLRQVFRSSSETQFNMDPLARPCELLHMFGWVPEEMVPDDGGKLRVITIANRAVLLRNNAVGIPVPHSNGLPFGKASALPDPYTFWNMSKVKAGVKPQILADHYASLKADALERVVDPMWVYNRNAGIKLDDLYSRPQGHIEVNLMDGESLSNAVMPLTPDLRGLSNLYPEINEMFRYIQLSSGLTQDAGLGFANSKRQTRTEFLGLQDAVTTRLFLEMRKMEIDALEPLAEAFARTNGIYLDEREAVQIIGANAIRDPITGEALRPEEIVGRGDFVGPYAIRAKAASGILSKSQRAAELVQLTQVFGAVPMAAIHINWRNYMRAITSVIDSFSQADILQLSPEEMAMNLAALSPPKMAPQAGGEVEEAA